MARVMLTLLGVAFLALGVWLCVIWWPHVYPLLLALLAVGVLVLGLIILVLGISELTGARPPKPSNPLGPDDND